MGQNALLQFLDQAVRRGTGAALSPVNRLVLAEVVAPALAGAAGRALRRLVQGGLTWSQDADERLVLLAAALVAYLETVAPGQVEVRRLSQEGTTLIAELAEGEGSDAVSPADFRAVVRRLGLRLLGETWSARLAPPPLVAAAPAPGVDAAA